MKKIYSIVLMATALLIGTNVWASDQTVTGTDFKALNDAIAATGGTGTVTLESDIIETVSKTNWVGTWIGDADYDADAKNITLNMNGHSITVNAEGGNYVVYPFVITKGELKIVNNAAKLSKIEVNVNTAADSNAKATKGTNVFFVFGSYDYTKNPMDEHPFSLLEIGANVSVITNNGTVIAVDAKTKTNAVATNYSTYYFTDRGFAFGARVEVKGSLSSKGGYKCYGIKTNGNLGYPGDTKRTVSTKESWIDADYKANIGSAAAIANAPYVHVWPGAKVESDNNQLGDASAAVYCSGYAQWKVEGACEGATGLYASSGDIDIKDATIKSGADWYHAPGGTGHADGGGSAIVINSRDAYAGAIEVEISGDTKVEAKTGYALEEAVNTTKTTVGDQEVQETKVENISINAGSFQGGTNPVSHEQQPAIIISNPTAKDDVAEVVVYGGNIDGPLVVNGDDNKSLEDFLDPEVHTTTVLVDGKNVTVVSEGAAPKGSATVADQAGKSVDWTGTSEALQADLTLTELEINQNDTTWKTVSGKKVIDKVTPIAQTLTIGDDNHNITVKIGRVVLGTAAKVIVNPGSKLIVTGEQGFVAPVVSNFILKTQEGNPAIFLFHPAVESNRHPAATIEFISKSFVASGSEWARQCFGIPSIGALDEIETEGNVPTVFGVFNYEKNAWEKVAGINKAPYTEDWSKFANPFEYYQMINYAAAPGTKVIMKGKLVGNDNPQLNVRGNFWNGYANSFMGPMNMEKLIEMIPNTVQKAIYLLDLTTSEFRWEPFSLAFMDENDAIDPLQPFLIRNNLAADDIAVDYADAVYYTPAGSGESKPGAAPAPRRAPASNVTKAKLIVKGEGCIDRVGVVEGEDFSAEFDNGYDAVKYMNEGFNMYVSADEKMSIFATDDLNNTYVGLQAIKGGNYTIEFANVQGAELTLIDHETGAQVAMVEGNTYEFTAAANSTNDYRFEIVDRNYVPTAIENTEAVKSAKGVYTITGQYVGEMNVWNTLPAGIYVVNGEKYVK